MIIKIRDKADYDRLEGIFNDAADTIAEEWVNLTGTMLDLFELRNLAREMKRPRKNRAFPYPHPVNPHAIVLVCLAQLIKAGRPPEETPC